MDHFAIVNLLDLDDSAAGAAGIEARFGRTALGSRDLGVSSFRYAPNFQSTTGHRHREQEEAYLVVEGEGAILLDGVPHELRQWDVVRVAPSVVRAFAGGPDGMHVVAIGGPKPEGGDGERAEVTWPASP
jgi:quercetin dioxygenase-like cupin family protein